MVEQIIIVGAGGFGREALDVAMAMQATGASLIVQGVVDDDGHADGIQKMTSIGVPYLGTTTDILKQDWAGKYVIAVGDPRARRKIAGKLASIERRPANLIHPTSSFGSRTHHGDGLIACAGARISNDVLIGDHVHINANAIVGHDATVGAFVSLNPGSIVSGFATIGDAGLIGAGAVVLQGLRVGDEAVVGAAACVVRDVEQGSVVKGVPAR